MTARIDQIRTHFDTLSSEIETWRARNRYYHHDQISHLRHLVGPGKSVLELGCGMGEMLHALQPSVGVGIDISPEMIRLAQIRYPGLTFRVGDANELGPQNDERFDVIILSDLVGYLEDVQYCLEGLHRFCHTETRVIISYYNFLWEPVLELAERLKLKMPTPEQSWLSPDDLVNLLELTDFEVVKIDRRLLFPKYVPLLSWVMNHIGTLPIVNRACLTHYVVARPGVRSPVADCSVTIVIPCRNEKGNIEPAIQRLPAFGTHQEIIFIDGHSTDGTQDEIHRVIDAYRDRDIKLLVQDGSGKGDAVRKGFEIASGDVLMILDADLTVPPEDLPKFYRAISSGKAEFLNGSRLVYPMEGEAMRTLNRIANKLFAMLFTWLLGQRFKDTLCGTKVMRRKDYRGLAANRGYFGNFDPFGDFDLMFGASRLNLKIMEIPIRYRARIYGKTNIRRFAHGFQLLRMVLYAYRKLKSV